MEEWDEGRIMYFMKQEVGEMHVNLEQIRGNVKGPI